MVQRYNLNGLHSDEGSCVQWSCTEGAQVVGDK